MSVCDSTSGVEIVLPTSSLTISADISDGGGGVGTKRIVVIRLRTAYEPESTSQYTLDVIDSASECEAPSVSFKVRLLQCVWNLFIQHSHLRYIIMFI